MHEKYVPRALETLAFAVGRHLAERTGADFVEQEMRERFQRHFRTDKNPKKTTPRRKRVQRKTGRPSETSATDEEEADDDFSSSSTSPRRRSTDDDDNDPPGAGAGGSRSAASRRGTPASGRKPSRSRSRSGTGTRSHSKGRKRSAPHDGDVQDLALTFCMGLHFHEVSPDDGTDPSPQRHGQDGFVEEELALTFCTGIVFHELSTNEEVDAIIAAPEQEQEIDDDNIKPGDSVSQQDSNSAPETSEDDDGTGPRPPATSSDETDTEVLDKDWLEGELPLSATSAMLCYLDEPRLCGAPGAADLPAESADDHSFDQKLPQHVSALCAYSFANADFTCALCH